MCVAEVVFGEAPCVVNPGAAVGVEVLTACVLRTWDRAGVRAFVVLGGAPVWLEVTVVALPVESALPFPGDTNFLASGGPSRPALSTAAFSSASTSSAHRTSASQTPSTASTAHNRSATSVPSPVTITATINSKENPGSKFDIGSFLGGIVLTLGVLSILYFGCKTYYSRRGIRYRTIDEHDAII